MAKGTEVAVPAAEPKAVIDAELAALYQQHAGGGFEDLKQTDYAIPFLKILQGLSPELQPDGEQFIEGAAQGDMVNSLTRELFKRAKGVRLIRVAQELKYIEWRPRKAGGGLVAISSTKEEAEAKRQPVLGNPDTDTEIIDTLQIYCLLETADGWQPIVLSWTKSKMKHARRWAFLASQVMTSSIKKIVTETGDRDVSGIPGPNRQMAIYAVVWHLTTKSEKNAKGTFFVPAPTAIGAAGPELLAAAVNFRQAITAGAVKVKYEKDDDAPAADVPGAGESDERAGV